MFTPSSTVFHRVKLGHRTFYSEEERKTRSMPKHDPGGRASDQQGGLRITAHIVGEQVGIYPEVGEPDL